jgi:hypothetical protein
MVNLRRPSSNYLAQRPLTSRVRAEESADRKNIELQRYRAVTDLDDNRLPACWCWPPQCALSCWVRWATLRPTWPSPRNSGGRLNLVGEHHAWARRANAVAIDFQGDIATTDADARRNKR